MRKFTIELIILALATTLSLTACSQIERTGESKVSIVCTIFPQYDWTRQIIGENVENFDLHLLLQSRIDLHSYQPSVEDIATIVNCDIFIYVGGESDSWVLDVLGQAKNKEMNVLCLMEILGDEAKIEEIIEGMEEEEEGEEEADEEEEFDEHVWLSLKNAKMFCTEIAEILMEIDSVNAGEYQKNLDAYITQLTNLDDEYVAFVETAPVKTLLFADRFPFRYLLDDYGIDYYAAFSGCSAQTEASFKTIAFLIDRVDELGLKSIIVTESSSQEIATAIISGSSDKNQEICTLNAMQSISTSDLQSGVTYLSIMESNLGVLREALQR